MCDTNLDGDDIKHWAEMQVAFIFENCILQQTGADAGLVNVIVFFILMSSPSLS